jgi:hypothetical protein
MRLGNPRTERDLATLRNQFNTPAPAANGPAPTANGLRQEALKQALDVRRFEIELYWKRATYFWTFIGAVMAGFIALHPAKGDPDQNEIAVMIGCLGLVLSVGWYFVNRGSKYWQENWEAHVTLHERDFQGPLFSTILEPRDSSFGRLTGNFPFSVSKINHIINLAIIMVWVLLLGKTINWKGDAVDCWVVATVILTIVCLFCLYRYGKSSFWLSEHVPPPETTPGEIRMRLYDLV